MLLILFLGLLLACKVTSFNATAASLAVVTVITFIVGLIPTIGGFVALVAQYFMLKKIDSQGAAIFTMLISILTTFFVGFVVMKAIGHVSFHF